MLGQMFDSQSQTTRTSWTNGQPVRTSWEILFGKRVAEGLVVKTKVFNVNSRLRHAGAASRLKGINRAIGQSFRYPATHWSTSQPFILEWTEMRKIVVSVDLSAWIPAEFLSVAQPEGTASVRIKMPGDNFTNPCIESGPGCVDFCLQG